MLGTLRLRAFAPWIQSRGDSRYAVINLTFPALFDLRALAKQKPFLVESFAPLPQALVKGEAQLGITYAQYTTQVKGPLGHVVFDKIFTDSTDLALGARVANPNAGKLYIDFLCTPEIQKVIAETGDFPVAPGIYPNVKDAEKVVANAIFMENPSEEEFKKLQAEFRKIFLMP